MTKTLDISTESLSIKWTVRCYTEISVSRQIPAEQMEILCINYTKTLFSFHVLMFCS